MNFTDMASYIRAVADTDIEDLPDAVLTVHLRAAYYDVRRRVPMWPHLRISTTLTTSANDDEYLLTDLGAELEFVEAIIGDTDKLEFVDRDTIDRWNEGIGVDHTTTEADYWNEQSGVITLYPTPSDTGTVYTVRGFRPFADFPVGNNEPDLPVEFHEALCSYALSRYYSSQEDLELAERWMRDYEVSVNRQIAAMLRSSTATARPRIFGGRRSSPLGYSSWVRRNTEG